MESNVDFSIITPSFNMLNYLKRCCASVVDQTDVTFEHIIVDGGSTDGTVDWLRQNHVGKSVSERDEGMYDAINKGLLMSLGNFVAYLNCDEQYLPSTLKIVKEYFEQNPKVDVVFGDTLVVRQDGSLIAYRKTHQPRWPYILASYLYILSCSLFIRRRVIKDGFLFDTSLKAVADADLVVRLLKEGYRFSHVRQYLATFTVTGENKIKTLDSVREAKIFRERASLWVKIFKFPLNMARFAERMLNGVYYQRLPLSYQIYTGDDLEKRSLFVANKASFRLSW